MGVPELVELSQEEEQQLSSFNITSQQLYEIAVAAQILAESSPKEAQGYRKLIVQAREGGEEAQQAQKIVLELAVLMQVLRDAAESTENNS